MASLAARPSGWTMSVLSAVMPKPHSSASTFAPRALAWCIDLQHENARALAQHGAVAFLGKRENALRRQQLRFLPRLHHAVGVGGVRGPDDGDIDEPIADVVAAEPDGVSGRGAGAAGGECRPLDAVLDADMRRGGRADEAHERQGVGGNLLELEDMAIGDLEVHDAAEGGADDAGGAIGALEGHLEPGLLHRLIRGGCCKQAVTVGVQDDLVALEVPEAGLLVEALDLGGYQHIQLEILDLGKSRECAGRSGESSRSAPPPTCPAACPPRNPPRSGRSGSRHPYR